MLTRNSELNFFEASAAEVFIHNNLCGVPRAGKPIGWIAH